MLDLEKYTWVDGKTPLSAAELNARFLALVRRLHELETLSTSWQEDMAAERQQRAALMDDALMTAAENAAMASSAATAATTKASTATTKATEAAASAAMASSAASTATTKAATATTKATEAAASATTAATAHTAAQTAAASAAASAVAVADFIGAINDLELPTIPPVLSFPFDLLVRRLPSSIMFSRASSAWSLSAAGALVEAAAGVPRFDYDANDGSLRGILTERTTVRLNTVAAAPTAAQNVTVTAQAYTVSFFGTGSIVLSGAHAATVGGVGPLPARASYTFTPTVGTLTLTPSGDVRHLQVEAGAFATSPILGEGSQVARAADVCNVPVSAIDFNVGEGTVFVEAITGGGPHTSYEYLVRIDDGGNSNQIRIMRYLGALSARVEYNGTNQCILTLGNVDNNTLIRIAFSWRLNNFKAVLNGGEPVLSTNGNIPLTTMMKIGLNFNGAIRQVNYFACAIADKQLKAMTV